MNISTGIGFLRSPELVLLSPLSLLDASDEDVESIDIRASLPLPLPSLSLSLAFSRSFSATALLLRARARFPNGNRRSREDTVEGSAAREPRVEDDHRERSMGSKPVS